MFLNLQSYGVGVGKSSLAYSCPLPAVAFAADAGAVRSLYGSRWKTWEGVDIELREYPVPDIEAEQFTWARNNGKALTVYLLPKPMQTGLRPQGVGAMWSYMIRLFRLALHSPLVRSVIHDTGTLINRMARDTYLEALPSTRVSLIQIEYGKPNGMVRDIFTEAQAEVEKAAVGPIESQKHYIITHHMTEDREDRVNSEGMVTSVVKTKPNGDPYVHMEGLTDAPRLFDVSLRMETRLVDNPLQPGSQVLVFESTFIKCGFDGSLVGQTIPSGTWDELVERINKNLHPRGRIQMRGF